MQEATINQEKSQGDFVTLFGEAFEKIDPNARLASIFLYEFKDKGITVNSTNNEVLKVLRAESEDAINRSYQILRTRIDRFGVAQPNIQKMENSGRILVELPGIKDPKRVRKLLQGTAQLEFWETYNFSELYRNFDEANAELAKSRKAKKALAEGTVEETPETVEEPAAVEGEEVAMNEETPEVAADSTEANLLDELAENAEETPEEALTEDEQLNQYQENNPLYAYLQPSYYQNEAGQIVPGETARMGIAQVKDTAVINQMLAEVREKNIFPRNCKGSSRRTGISSAEPWFDEISISRRNNIVFFCRGFERISTCCNHCFVLLQ